MCLDGGPGPGAPQHAAASMTDLCVSVTDPSGKTRSRPIQSNAGNFTISAGIIVSTAPRVALTQPAMT